MVFILDLLILYTFFLVVFLQQEGHVAIPIAGVGLMLFIALAWFTIALNSTIVNLSIDCNLFEEKLGTYAKV